MLPGDKFSRFIILEKSKIEQAAVEPNTKALLKELMEDIVRFLETTKD